MNARRAMTSALLVAIALAASACKGKVGDTCKSGDVVCVDETSALVCVGGAYAAAGCPGPDGCKKTLSGAVKCDYRGAATGATCYPNRDAPRVCSVDEASAYACIDNKVTQDICDDSRGAGRPRCFAANGAVHCHVTPSPPKPGDKCDSAAEGKMTCADGAKSYVTCTKGKYELTAMCRGPLGCKPFPELESVACDTKFGVAGEACVTGVTCTADGSTLLTCDGQKLTTVRKCRGPRACDATRANDECDDSVADVGDGCAAGDKACSSDGKSLLECKAGASTYTLEKECAKGCVASGGKSRCN